jgi:limonene-1,2-epoxide hydrolase
MTEDVVWQTSVPTVPPVVGRDACKAEIDRQNTFCTGGLPGSQVRNIASNDNVVFTERLDVLDLAGTRVELCIVGVFEIREGKVAARREYFDMNSLAAQLHTEANSMRTHTDPTVHLEQRPICRSARPERADRERFRGGGRWHQSVRYRSDDDERVSPNTLPAEGLSPVS